MHHAAGDEVRRRWHRDRMTRGMLAVILVVVIVLGTTLGLTFELVQEAVRSRPPAR